MNRFLRYALALTILVGCSSHKNPAGFVQPDESAGKLVVSSTRAGGWLGKDNQPQLSSVGAIYHRDSRFAMGVGGYNPTDFDATNAYVHIIYDPDVFTIHGVIVDHSGEPQEYDDLVPVPGHLKFRLKLPTKASWGYFAFTWLDVTVGLDAPLGRTKVLYDVTFYDANGKSLGSQVFHHKITIIE